jgi:predicted nucleic acid-binding protein
MTFWDSSAVVPLLVQESNTKTVQKILEKNSDMIVWWGTEIECVSAIVRLEREGKIDSNNVDIALSRLDNLKKLWNEILPVEQVKSLARRMLRVHSLHAADSFQLSAAICASNANPSALDFVCFDKQLIFAAKREGLKIS